MTEAARRAELAEVIRAAHDRHVDGDGYFPAADQVLVWMLPIIADAIAQAVQAERERIIADFRWWQDKFPDEDVPWQIIYVQRPDTITPEQLAQAREVWLRRDAGGEDGANDE